MLTTYAIPTSAHKTLDALVDKVEANPGRMVDPAEIADLKGTMDVRATMDQLPEGLSEDDFTGILKLAMLTECATDSYATAIQERSDTYDTPWLGRFNQNVWVPDERCHADPYREMFLTLGYSEAELDAEILETQEREYIHRSGDTPVHITTFGMIQEYLTDNWHGLIADLLKSSSPAASHIANRIKQRETLHTIWYRDMTALQVEANPHLIQHVGEALVGFRMPGQELLPALQNRVPGWLPSMNANFDLMTKDLVRHIHGSLGDSLHNSGELLVSIAAERDMKLGPVHPSHLRKALNRLGGPGYGLIGEALLMKVGLDRLYQAPTESASGPTAAVHRRVEQIRSVFRGWIADRMNVEVGYEGY